MNAETAHPGSVSNNEALHIPLESPPDDEGFVSDDVATIVLTPEEFPALTLVHQIVLRKGLTARKVAEIVKRLGEDGEDDDDNMGRVELMLEQLIVSWTFRREPTAENIARLNPNIYIRLMEEATAYLPLAESTSSVPTTAPS